MISFQRILCPVDLSAAAAAALRYAAALSAKLNAELSALVVRPGRGTDAGEADSPELEAFIGSSVGGAGAVTRLQRHGDPTAEILRTAGAIGADLIAMGTHGRSGLQRLLVGSVTEAVLRRSTTPVLVVSQAAEQRPDFARLQLVLCAVDFSPSSRRAVEYAASLAASAGASLLLAHVLEWAEEREALVPSAGHGFPTSEDDAAARLEDFITSDMRARCRPEVALGYGEPADELLYMTQERQADIIVLGAASRGAIGSRVFGSAAQSLIRQAGRPVLSIGAPHLR